MAAPVPTEQFYSLTPDVVMAGVEAAGFSPTGEYIQLNSYENRVFDIRIESKERIIAKYYRPARWSQKAILEEHFFLEELKSQGIPAVAPLKQANGQTLSTYEGIHLALFPKAMGRIPQELNLAELRQVGRALAHIHNVGEQGKAKYRPRLDVETYGWPAFELIQSQVAPEVEARYLKAAEAILHFLEKALADVSYQRIHGDCHKGNLLQQDTREGARGFFFLDFDDFCTGPAAQDLWMLLSAEEDIRADEQAALLEGYEDLRVINPDEFRLFEPLRGLRILHYAGWIIRRWEDPSFPKLFPDFGSYGYWAEEAEALEKIAWALLR